jgi:saccharopine dehydrogenase-like NADP-dependent oxidoreductase
VLLALLNSASYFSNSQTVTVQGKELMAHAQPYYISPAYAFVAYPNRDSTPFKEWYDIPEAETIVRGTLRYQGFPEFVKALVQLGWLDETRKEWLVEGMEWREVMKRVVGADDTSEKCVLLSFCPSLC